MPQASEELRDKIKKYFNNELMDDWAVSQYLLSKGWVMDNKFIWHPPSEKCSQKEVDCIRYLIHEWDYGYSPHDGTGRH